MIEYRVHLDSESPLCQADQGRYGELLDKATEMAAQIRVFGSPTFRVGKQMFLGSDRVDFLAEALKAEAPAPRAA